MSAGATMSFFDVLVRIATFDARASELDQHERVQASHQVNACENEGTAGLTLGNKLLGSKHSQDKGDESTLHLAHSSGRFMFSKLRSCNHAVLERGSV